MLVAVLINGLGLVRLYRPYTDAPLKPTNLIFYITDSDVKSTVTCFS